MRNLARVIQDVLKHVPSDQVTLRAALERLQYESERTAPEVLAPLWAEAQRALTTELEPVERAPSTPSTPSRAWVQNVWNAWCGKSLAMLPLEERPR